MPTSVPPIVLSFAATDPTGGAGIQADLLTLSSMGCHALTVVTAITVQDTAGVEDVLPIDADWVSDQARVILERVCYLPASKRKPLDTYWTLTGTNMVHTEFPNHQENVRKMAEAEGFQLADYVESIQGEFAPEVLKKLNTIPDFRKGYELNRELAGVLREVGIAGDFGKSGHTPEQWPEFGPVQKTSAEFKAAYDKFRDDMLALFQAVTKPARTSKARGRTPSRNRRFRR